MREINIKYVIDKGTYYDFVRDAEGRFKCPFCGDYFRAIAYHTRQIEYVSAKQLRKLMGLKQNYRLITDDLAERHREIVFENEETHLKQNLLVKGNKTRYKNGSIGHTKSKWSPQGLAQLSARRKKNGS